MPDEPEQESSFEDALTQLERIVASLERGEAELTTALAKYEKGVRLLALCQRLLDQAEHSIALLTGVDENGNPVTAPFDATSTIAREADSAGASSAPPTANDTWPKPPNRAPSPKSLPIPEDDRAESTDPPF
jgi:exodeoxyribonuclease VII small subunit